MNESSFAFSKSPILLPEISRWHWLCPKTNLLSVNFRVEVENSAQRWREDYKRLMRCQTSNLASISPTKLYGLFLFQKYGGSTKNGLVFGIIAIQKLLKLRPFGWDSHRVIHLRRNVWQARVVCTSFATYNRSQCNRECFRVEAERWCKSRFRGWMKPHHVYRRSWWPRSPRSNGPSTPHHIVLSLNSTVRNINTSTNQTMKINVKPNTWKIIKILKKLTDSIFLFDHFGKSSWYKMGHAWSRTRGHVIVVVELPEGWVANHLGT